MENETSISLGGGGDYNFTRSLCAKLNLWARIHFESILRPSQSLQKSLKYKKVSFFTFPGENVSVRYEGTLH